LPAIAGAHLTGTIPRAQATCLVNPQPEEEMGCSLADEDLCGGEILTDVWTVFGLLRREVENLENGSRVP
jgi:hypothetical protein